MERGDSRVLLWRTALTLCVLSGFYLSTLLLGLVLVAATPALVWAATVHHQPLDGNVLWLFILTTIPGLLLLRGLLVRPPKFAADGLRLQEADAPELFRVLDDLARQAATRKPDEVYLLPVLTVGVTEYGGTFGIGSCRTLLLGAPCLALLTVDQLRAALAHELGHFQNGDTKLAGVTSFAHALFRSVLRATSGALHPAEASVIKSVAANLGHAWVRLWAKIYLGLLRPLDRRQELAADRLAVRLVGSRALIEGLETLETSGTLYEAYLANDLVFALLHQALPTNLLEGFETFRRKHEARGIREELLRAARGRRTDPFDCHPSLAERVSAAIEVAPPEALGDTRSASCLLADETHLARLLPDLTEKMFVTKPPPTRMPWEVVGVRAVVPAIQRDAWTLASSLQRWYPGPPPVAELFGRVVADVARGYAVGLAFEIDPQLRALPANFLPQPVERTVTELVEILFCASLVHAGATIEPFLGEPSFTRAFTLEGRRVVPFELARNAMHDDRGIQVLREWSERLVALAGVHSSANEVPR